MKRYVATIVVNKKIDEVFRVWKNFENMTRYMKNLKSITTTGDSVTHWEMTGPFGGIYEWDARTTALETNKKIGWESFQGDIKTTGEVDFEKFDGNSCKVTLILNYELGQVREMVAAAFDPQRQLDEDMERFKEYVEKKP